ncbi:MAG: thiazole synthase [Acidobacteriota bacterium]
MSTTLRLGDHELSSRLILGTGKYASLELMKEALTVSGTEMVTVAVRRVELGERGTGAFIDYLPEGMALLPNTAGCYTADDAVRTARLAREAGYSSLVKLEVIGDERTLYPDVVGLLEATETLVKEGFTVLPYTNTDPVVERELLERGAAAIMPLASPIGSGQGVSDANALRILRELFPDTTLIVDAGVGTASDAALAMELGADGILMNTGVASAADPVAMARAMGLAVEAGWLAASAGRIPRKLHASASSPNEGMISS